MAETGLPHQWRMCGETGRLENLDRCGRGESGGYHGLRFNDSDVYKLLEASAYATSIGLGEAVSSYVEASVRLIENAQDKDGYINSFVQLTCPSMRWKSLNALHEMYCIGHLIEASVAHAAATGDGRLLGVGRRAADHVMSVFGPGLRLGYPGHQEIELALVRLAETCCDAKYAEFARWLVQQRGSRPSPYQAELEDSSVVALTPGVKPLFVKDGAYDGAYAQDDVPLREQTRAVGHAVRAMYYYCGAVGTLFSDTAVSAALLRIWDSLVSRQMYVTGGIGSSGRNEGFTDDYDLPNLDAYAETCAAIGLVFWAWRMFLAMREARFVDVMERALFNAALSGVSFSCDRYFYENPLESDGRHERAQWFSCACCPPNIARLVMSIGQYSVGASSDSAFVALPMSGTFDCGCCRLVVEAAYPWSGTYSIRLESVDGLRTIGVRSPTWARGTQISINGRGVQAKESGGFILIEREWAKGDEVTVESGMDAEWIQSHSAVLPNAGRVALQRGPLVYCLEQIDLGAAPHHWMAVTREPLRVVTNGDERAGAFVDAPGMLEMSRDEGLYRPYVAHKPMPKPARFVPYFSWANRGTNAMQVWVRRAD